MRNRDSRPPLALVPGADPSAEHATRQFFYGTHWVDLMRGLSPDAAGIENPFAFKPFPGHILESSMVGQKHHHIGLFKRFL